MIGVAYTVEHYWVAATIRQSNPRNPIMTEDKPPLTVEELLPDLPGYDPEPADGVRVGESPVPGLTLKRILRSHTDVINRIAWSNNGKYLVTPSADKSVKVWDVAKGDEVFSMAHHTNRVYSAAWSPDDQKIVSGNWYDPTWIWDPFLEGSFRKIGTNNQKVNSVLWSPNSSEIFCGTQSAQFKRIHFQTGVKSTTKFLEYGSINNMSLSANKEQVLLATSNGYLVVWNIKRESAQLAIKISRSQVFDCAWSSNNQQIIGCSWDGTVQVFNLDQKLRSATLEGHTAKISSCSISKSEDILATKAHDGSVSFWDIERKNFICSIPERSSQRNSPSLAFHPHFFILATLGDEDKSVRIWELDLTIFTESKSIQSSKYSAAKIVLVGDSGVGKTGLGWRIAHGEFKEQISTHGQQFWVIDKLTKPQNNGIECEAVLWDLAGQPDYRLVHSLFIDDVDTALVLFDPTNRREPLSGVEFWLNQLKNENKELCSTILVGARTDRGVSTLTNAELEAYCEHHGIKGGYISTSAATGEGISELMENLKRSIPWDEIPATITTVTFKRIKDFVLDLKAQPEKENVLLEPNSLRRQLEITDQDWEFSDAEMMTAVGHLETHGYAKVLKGSEGAQSILLTPDVLVNLASSLVLEARRNPMGLGVLEEETLLTGGYRFQELQKLDESEQEVLLDAVAVLFLEKNLCFRETFNQRIFLVFPSLINEKRPVTTEFQIVESGSYRVKGAVENIYSSLVVLLGYTNTFIRTHHWQNQAQYEMGDGEICGFQQTDYGDGEIELLIYYADNTPDPVRLAFQGLFERFLNRGGLEIFRYQPVICGGCHTQLARNVVMKQLERGRDFSFCNECGNKLILPNPEPLTRLSHREEIMLEAQQTVAQYRTNFAAALVRVKSLTRDLAEEDHPSAFISYAWGVSEHERWVLQFAKDLRDAGIAILLDRWDSPPGSNLDHFIERIDKVNYVLPVGTPGLLTKYEAKEKNSVVTAELNLINYRVRNPDEYGESILPILLEGTGKTSFSPQLRPLVSLDFRQEDFYFRKLFDLIWRLYDLPFDHPILEELHDALSPQRI